MQKENESFLKTFFASYRMFSDASSVLDVLDELLLSGTRCCTHDGVMLTLRTWSMTVPEDFKEADVIAKAMGLTQFCQSVAIRGLSRLLARAVQAELSNIRHPPVVESPVVSQRLRSVVFIPASQLALALTHITADVFKMVSLGDLVAAMASNADCDAFARIEANSNTMRNMVCAELGRAADDNATSALLTLFCTTAGLLHDHGNHHAAAALTAAVMWWCDASDVDLESRVASKSILKTVVRLHDMYQPAQ